MNMTSFSSAHQSELYGMRKEFWESRVDGIPDIYVALKSVCEAMLNNDSGLADAILQVSSFTCNIVFNKTVLFTLHDDRPAASPQ